MTRVRRVYLAGPFTHPEPQQVEANIRSAVEAGRALRAAGLVPVIPHIAVPDEPGATPAQIWTIAMRECLSHLRSCDAIVLLPRWETSRGARVEHALCHRCVPGYPTDIYHSVLAVLERGGVMTELEMEEILQRAIDTWGRHEQEQMAIGECGEFLSLFGRKVQGRLTLEAMVDEIADVTIMMRQMARIYGEDLVKVRIQYKLRRLEQKLNKDCP